MRNKPKPSLILAGVVAVVGLSATAAFATITSPIDPAGSAAPLSATDPAESPTTRPQGATPADDAASPATVPAAAKPAAVPVKAQPVTVLPIAAKPVAQPVRARAAVPVKASPLKAVPVKSAPVKAVPVKTLPVKADPTKDPGKDCNHDGKADDSTRTAGWHNGAGHAIAQRAKNTAHHDRGGRHHGNGRSNGNNRGGHH